MITLRIYIYFSQIPSGTGMLPDLIFRLRPPERQEPTFDAGSHSVCVTKNIAATHSTNE